MQEKDSVPAIRFAGFTDAWEQRKLGGLVQFSKGTGYSKADLKEKGTPIILYGRLYTKYKTVISDVDTYADARDGLNLQSGGSTIVWFGLTWSLELYQQTNARLWRQGQNSKTVVVQHIITKGTIDERIMKALSEKDSTQQSLIDAVKAVL